MARNFKKFLLLLWKNFMLQLRHPLQTVIEILAPVFFTSLLVVIRSLVKPELHPDTTYAPFQNDIPFNNTFVTLPWSPANPALESIMNDMSQNIHNLYKDNIVVPVSLNDSESLKNFLSNDFNLLTSVAGIQFDDSLAGQVSLPSKINVEIRFSGELKRDRNSNWNTNKLFPTYQVGGPRDWDKNEGAIPQYYKEKFLMLQQELSFSIINHFKREVHNRSFDHNAVPIVMQRFPYPEWTQDDLLTALQAFVGLIVMLSFVYTCINTVKIITVEKEKQLKEAMKIMGLPNWLHWTAWFIKQFIFLLISSILIVILLKIKWYSGTENSVFTNSDPILLLIFLQIFASSTIALCFVISVFFSKANTAATVAGLIWFLSYFPYSFLRKSYDTLTLVQKLFACLCSNTAMAYGFQTILMFEGMEEGLQFHNVWKPTNPEDDLVFGHLLMMLLFDTFLYSVVAFYVEAIYPGEYGIPQPWYFPFSWSFWFGRKSVLEIDDVEESLIDHELQEDEPTNLKIGIKIRNLRKKYSNKKVAVNDLSFNMYKDQITVLLGHNGAGKTTTISMLIGMCPPSNGTAFIDGHNIVTDISDVRQNLGFCPQHNILYDEFTVAEHLYFYCSIKGMKKEQIDDEISEYLELLELSPKRDVRSSTLSGGMKRKLSVAIALCGNSSIVICDEPSSGMDPAARRSLWNLLQKQKTGRTILLSTHYMDEADLLGDRIAIMAEGNLQCYGSSFFLKKKYGAGYHLVLVKSPECDIHKVTTLLQKYIPNIQIKTNVGFELTYSLREEDTSIFETMFADLEQNCNSLGISSYGISFTTLEDVFMKVGTEQNQPINDDSEEVKNENHRDLNNTTENLDISLHLQSNLGSYAGVSPTYWTLWTNQFLAMLMKRVLSIYRSWILFLLQIFMPILFISLAIILYRKKNVSQDLPNLKIGLQSYEDAVTVLTSTANNSYSKRYINILAESNSDYINWENQNFTEEMIEETMKNVLAVRQRYIVGATFKNNSITAWFNNQPYHSPPLALQMVINAIFQEEVSTNHSIQVFNHPLPYTINTKLNNLLQVGTLGFQVAFNLGFSMAYVSAFYIMFYVKERVSQSKHLQFVSGISVLIFWIASFVCDIITFIFASLLILITLLIFHEEGFSSVEELARLFSILCYFGVAALPITYLASYFFQVPSTGYSRMALINIFTGVAAFLVVTILMQPELNLQNTAKTLDWIFLIFPHYSLSAGVQNQYMIYSTHKLCNFFIETCVNITTPIMLNLTPDECKTRICKLQSICCTMTDNYYDIDSPGIGRNVLISLFSGIILILILLSTEHGALKRILNKIYKRPSPVHSQTDQMIDDDVLNEKFKVANLPLEDIRNTNLVMSNVTKCYNKNVAVNNLSLCVGQCECFGLLGLNGAGKTTTFKLLTGDVDLTHGDIWVNGLNFKNDRRKIFKSIGYCPQFDALLDALTCRETIIMFSLLRGSGINKSKMEANNLAKVLNFYKHLDKKVKELSGGNKRKLSTAIALIGNPSVIYLDEPTAGMDPSTKRYLWNTLCKIRDSGKCIVLTSHSMEECEALCTRLAIMVNGTLMCLGSTQHLKNKFSDGYTLTIKAKKDVDDNFDLEPIEKFVFDNFGGSVIREKHQQLVTFYIQQKTLSWSKMFGILERGKNLLNIEDYSLSQSSLEQVFLSFTKHQHEEVVNRD